MSKRHVRNVAASNRALELLGKHVGMFQEHSTVDHRHAHIVVTEHGVRDERLVGFSIEELEAWLRREHYADD